MGSDTSLDHKRKVEFLDRKKDNSATILPKKPAEVILKRDTTLPKDISRPLDEQFAQTKLMKRDSNVTYKLKDDAD